MTHPSSNDLYTPITPEIVQLMERMKARHQTWRDVSYITGTRLKVLRRIRRRERKTISMTLLDRMITTTGVGSIDDYLWFTADDLVAMGIWEPPAENVEGFPSEWKEEAKKRNR